MNKRNINIIIIAVLIFLIIVGIIHSYKETFSKNIQIIYYAYIRKDKWRYIVLPQMQDLVDCEILSEADLLVALSGEKELMNEAEMEIRKIIDPHLTNIRFTYTEENLFEYPGIKALYEESTAHPEKIYLYFHSKGMSFHGDDHVRYSSEKIIFDTVVKNWKHAINVFNTMPHINKVCFGSSNSGFCWYNFFWVRGSYMTTLDEPIISDNRYYYESYIEGKQKTHEDCYNLIHNNEKPFFNPDEVNSITAV